MADRPDRIGRTGGDEAPGRREEAAGLVAEDRLSDRQIAERVGVVRSTLAAWKKDPEFKAMVDSVKADIRAGVRLRGVADLDARIAALDARWRELHGVIEERAIAPEMQNVPGGKTGLLARTLKGDGKGGTIEEFSVDTGLLKELRELEKQAAKELGQWVDRTEDIADEPDDLDEIRGRFDRRLRARRDGGIPGEPVPG